MAESTGGQAASPSMVSERAFFAVSALLFAATAVVTIVWCGSMSAMGMQMPGGWTMSMAWMRILDRRGSAPRCHSSSYEW
jgi:hypothetical protein